MKRHRKSSYLAKKHKTLETISEIYHKNNGVVGYRNMKVYLERKCIVLSRITVHKYMNKELGLVSIVRHKKPTYESGEAHKKSVDVYSSPYRVGRHYTRFYGDFYTTDGEYITSLHWSKRGYH